ncbi:MAG: AAA family ATPase [Gemmatimonadota bacterium]|nr:AAA family ATPase [Gemmatimonadota bacterium]
MPFLRSVTLKPARPTDAAESYPFSVPAVRAMRELKFPTQVTFLVGENGSGKSTLLEGIAAAARLPTVGAESIEDDATLAPARALAARLSLSWSPRTHKGFFLRAEDFFGFAKTVAKLRAEMLNRVAEVNEEFKDASAYARGLAAGPALTSIGELERRYGVDLDANSHGQSFLKLFQSRLVGGGLYLLDEPEAPLSPTSQLALMAMIFDMLVPGSTPSQFIIATHSPILLAFPGATIYTFDQSPFAAVAYADLEHVNLTRDFLNDPSIFLRHLMDPDLDRPTDV